MSNEIAVLMPDEGKMGPCMRALTARQQKFVIAMLDLGCVSNHVRAAELAGYSEGGSYGALRVTAHRLAHDAKIQAAMLEEARARLQTGTIAAVSLLVETIGDTTAERKDRLKAAQMLMDRGGLHALTEHKVNVEHTDDRATKLAKLVLLAKQQGVDPRQLLGGLADVIDTDFQVIEEDDGREGLEDLLG